MADRFKEKERRAAKRRLRVRSKLRGTSEVPRLTVAKSHKNVFMQIIDDARQVTLVGLATNSKVMAGKFEDSDTKTIQAGKLGQALADLALDRGITKVVFDRNQYRYHGRVKAAAEGARKQGLEF